MAKGRAGELTLAMVSYTALVMTLFQGLAVNACGPTCGQNEVYCTVNATGTDGCGTKCDSITACIAGEDEDGCSTTSTSESSSTVTSTTSMTTSAATTTLMTTSTPTTTLMTTSAATTTLMTTSTPTTTLMTTSAATTTLMTTISTSDALASSRATSPPQGEKKKFKRWFLRLFTALG